MRRASALLSASRLLLCASAITIAALASAATIATATTAWPVQAYPFSAPNGWLPQKPREGNAIQRLHWTNDKSSFDVYTLANVKTLSQFEAVTHGGPLNFDQFVKQTEMRICNARAYQKTFHHGSTIQERVAIINDQAWVWLYARPDGSAADPELNRAMDTLCPDVVTSSTATLPPPWTDVRAAVGSTVILQTWSAPGKPGTLALRVALVDEDLRAFITQDYNLAAGAGIANSTSAPRPTQLCGLAAQEFDWTFQDRKIEAIATIKAGVAYELRYERRSTVPADQSVRDSMKTLCPDTSVAVATPVPVPPLKFTPGLGWKVGPSSPDLADANYWIRGDEKTRENLIAGGRWDSRPLEQVAADEELKVRTLAGGMTVDKPLRICHGTQVSWMISFNHPQFIFELFTKNTDATYFVFYNSVKPRRVDAAFLKMFDSFCAPT